MTVEETIYLDYAAATPIDERVVQAMLPYMTEKFYNPSSPYAPAVYLKREYEEAKNRIARVIGAKGDELIMTAGATESIAIALSSFDGHMITSSIEHHSVLNIAKTKNSTIINATKKGVVDVEGLKKAIKPETGLISIALANNELGTIQPIKDIARFVKQENEKRHEVGNQTRLLLHCDASQGLGQLDVHVARLGVDLLTMNAGKIYGPKQVGCLWVKPGVIVKPFLPGGGQERGIRSGTENVSGVMGFARAMELIDGHYQHESKRLAKLRDDLQSLLLKSHPDMLINGDTKRRLAGHLHVSFPGIDAERLIFILENQGVLVATGSACAANYDTRSHVLTAIGLSDLEADGSLRISLGRFTNKTQIDKAYQAITQAIDLELRRVK